MQDITMSCTLDCQMRFLSEKRTKTYKCYGAGASEDKIVIGAKSDWQGRALPELERRGV